MGPAASKGNGLLIWRVLAAASTLLRKTISLSDTKAPYWHSSSTCRKQKQLSNNTCEHDIEGLDELAIFHKEYSLFFIAEVSPCT